MSTPTTHDEAKPEVEETNFPVIDPPSPGGTLTNPEEDFPVIDPPTPGRI
jgi:hypothetical protein